MEMFWLKGCARCGGDLYLGDGDWQCLQCGRSYYRNTSPGHLRRERAWGGGSFGRASHRRDGLGNGHLADKSVGGQPAYKL